MIPVILSAPASVDDAIAAVQHQPYPSVWIGHDGSQWDFARIDGPLLVQNNVIGLHDPQFDRFVSSSASLPGHRLRGVRAKAREVFWPLLFRANTPEDWLTAYSGFFRSIHPQKRGLWRVGTGKQTRELELTGIYDSNYAMRHDPFTLGWASIGVQMEAEQPFWRGQAIERGPWRAENSVPFFPGPAYRISSSRAFGSASIPNPGDVPTWLKWKIVGPLAPITVGVGASPIEVPFDVPNGSVLEIDMDPRNQYATLDGEDVTEALGFQEFDPVEPGENVSLVVEAAGAGGIWASLTPLYFRAFG